MASVKFEKGSKEFQLFGDFWTFVQKFYIPEESSEYWDDLMDCADQLSKKYQDDDCYELARELFINICGFMARKHKQATRRT